MRVLYLIILLILTDLTQVSGQVSNDLGKLGLKGNVRSIREISYIDASKYGGGYYKESKGDINKTDCVDIFTEFNKEGKIITKKIFDNNGEICKKYTYKYFHGRLQKIIANIYRNFPIVKKGEYLSKEFKYFPNGKVREEKQYNTEGFETIRLNTGDWLCTKYYYYDKYGNLRKYSCKHADAEWNDEAIYSYDSKGRKIIEILNPSYDGSEGFYSFITNYYYNKSGKVDFKIIKYNSGDKKGEITERIYYYYNSLGNLIKELRKNANDKIKEIIKYDDYGNIIEDFLGNNYTKKYKYYFDKQKNWWKRIEYFNGKPKYVVEREIEYYPKVIINVK
jgi:hypothetical protein